MKHDSVILRNKGKSQYACINTLHGASSVPCESASSMHVTDIHITWSVWCSMSECFVYACNRYTHYTEHLVFHVRVLRLCTSGKPTFYFIVLYCAFSCFFLLFLAFQ